MKGVEAARESIAEIQERGVNVYAPTFNINVKTVMGDNNELRDHAQAAIVGGSGNKVEHSQFYLEASRRVASNELGDDDRRSLQSLLDDLFRRAGEREESGGQQKISKSDARSTATRLNELAEAYEKGEEQKKVSALASWQQWLTSKGSEFMQAISDAAKLAGVAESVLKLLGI